MMALAADCNLRLAFAAVSVCVWKIFICAAFLGGLFHASVVVRRGSVLWTHARAKVQLAICTV